MIATEYGMSKSTTHRAEAAPKHLGTLENLALSNPHAVSLPMASLKALPATLGSGEQWYSEATEEFSSPECWKSGRTA